MDRYFEQQLAHHCAPALAGIKPACLFSCFYKDFPRFEEMLAEYQAVFAAKGIRLRVLFRCARRFLVLVYRETALALHLHKQDVRAALTADGYPPCGELECCLKRLQARCADGGIPHEVGLFLGYPVRDVLAFQQCKGRGCLLCGYWKVYHDPDTARATFARYDRCRDAVCRRLEGGKTLAQLFCAA